MKKRWYILALLLSLLTGFAFGQESWNLGSSEDWLSIGPVNHIGPYYYPDSDLPIGIQRFLINYPSYPPIYYPSYYPTYYPYNYYFDYFPLGTFGLKHGGNWQY